MATEETSPSEIQINVKGPSELKLQITISPDKTVQELKQAIAEKSDVEADRQRLIYSGRVLKDEDLLSVYKIQSSHTIHMVKGVARSGGASGSSSTGAGTQPSSQPLPSMQTGQNPHDPLTQLNSHLGYGAMAGINPFSDMGLNPNDPNMLQSMMNSPQFLQQMSSMLSDPAMMEQLIAMDPRMASMAPQIRETMQRPEFREMLANPERLQQMLRLASAFGGPGAGGGMLGGGGASGFPAPGVPGGQQAGTGTGTGTGSPQPSSPGGTAQPNPFSLFGNPGAAGSGAGGLPQPDPALLQMLLGGGVGSGFTGAGGGGFGGLGSPPAQPADSRPLEERFQVQLQQLQDMGFTNAAQNVRALLATGGNVHSAIEYILGGGGL